jgi:hypothetical protein
MTPQRQSLRSPEPLSTIPLSSAEKRVFAFEKRRRIARTILLSVCCLDIDDLRPQPKSSAVCGAWQPSGSGIQRHISGLLNSV